MADIERRSNDLLERTEPTASPAAASTVPSIHMEPAGDSWRILSDGIEFHLKDMKGVRLLSRLIENVGREYHVLDLMSEKAAEQAGDSGDAGAILDEQAKKDYYARVQTLPRRNCGSGGVERPEPRRQGTNGARVPHKGACTGGGPRR